MDEKRNGLLKNLTREQAAGGAFSLSALLPSVFSLLFLIVITALGLTEKKGFENQDWYLYASYLISPAVFLTVAVVFFRVTKTSVADAIGRGKSRYFFIAIVLQLGLFSLSELNTLFLDFLYKNFGYESSEILLPSVWDAKIVGVIFVVAVLPAVFEELFFRGIVLGGLKRYGTAFAVLACGGLFALYHQNPAQTAYQFCCGAAFALVALKAESILPTVIAHFLNNTVIIVLYRFGVAEFSRAFQIPFLICSALALAGSLAYLLFGDKRQPIQTEKPKKKDFFLWAFVGTLVLGISWLSAFFTGV